MIGLEAYHHLRSAAHRQLRSGVEAPELAPILSDPPARPLAGTPEQTCQHTQMRGTSGDKIFVHTTCCQIVKANEPMCTGKLSEHVMVVGADTTSCLMLLHQPVLHMIVSPI